MKKIIFKVKKFISEHENVLPIVAGCVGGAILFGIGYKKACVDMFKAVTGIKV